MYKIHNPKGFIVYKATLTDLTKIGGFGVCDHCNNMASEGYLVAVLNNYLCPNCYEEWYSYAENYEEDRMWEKKTAQYYERAIGLED